MIDFILDFFGIKLDLMVHEEQAIAKVRHLDGEVPQYKLGEALLVDFQSLQKMKHRRCCYGGGLEVCVLVFQREVRQDRGAGPPQAGRVRNVRDEFEQGGQEVQGGGVRDLPPHSGEDEELHALNFFSRTGAVWQIGQHVWR